MRQGRCGHADARRQSFARQTFTLANREPLSCWISSNHARDRADDGAPKQMWLAEQLRVDERNAA
jgi:hypothetical protein